MSTSVEHDEPTRGTRYYRGLTHASIRRPVGTLALASVVLVLGLFFVDRLAVNLLPEVVYPHIRVTVNYPGVAPEVMEEQVARVLERSTGLPASRRPAAWCANSRSSSTRSGCTPTA